MANAVQPRPASLPESPAKNAAKEKGMIETLIEKIKEFVLSIYHKIASWFGKGKPSFQLNPEMKKKVELLQCFRALDELSQSMIACDIGKANYTRQKFLQYMKEGYAGLGAELIQDNPLLLEQYFETQNQ